MKNNWNIGESTQKNVKPEPERAILVGVIHGDQTERQIQEYLDELEFLAQTAGAITIKRFTQNLDHPDSRTYIRKGKLEEIQQYIESHDIDLVIFDDDLTGKQTQIIEEHLKRKIVDRSSLILDIFALRAQTAQAKTQVELAQMQYLLPRLRGLWTHLERQRGGIGMRGPGEQEIETDRRIIRDKITYLKKKLETIDKQNQTQRKNRGELIRVALVGYTNVGKSTLMNVLSKSEVFAENKLFATLDTTVRKIVLEQTPFLLSDTVGFIRKLPHHLVESFKSTLDEVRESDLLLHVIDIAHPQFEDHIRTVHETLTEMGVMDKPMILVFNKIDLYRTEHYDAYLDGQTKREIEEDLSQRLYHEYDKEILLVSAKSGENLDALRATLLDHVKNLYQVRYPYTTKQW
ncbi:MAG TPA: GTPase HflX [Saprospiraceae bacterium]|nr:GTPase HflX [Saprospiraceae bacterium]HPG07351.1 GTPase HflX [Saprospiraceae bacterium]HRV85362.1 GTPase HflX [Saprospiraceae bacterium]